MWTEVETDYRYQLLRDAETVYDGIGDVLVLHLLQHAGNDGIACLIVGEEFLLGFTICQQLLYFRCSHLSQRLLVGLGVIKELTIDEALAQNSP